MIGEQDVAPCREDGHFVVHGARIAPGSAANPSGKPRRPRLHYYRAADPWPLIGSGQDLADVRGRLPCGGDTIALRIAVQARLPLPALHQAWICENRRARQSRDSQAAGEVQGALGG